MYSSLISAKGAEESSILASSATAQQACPGLMMLAQVNVVLLGKLIRQHRGQTLMLEIMAQVVSRRRHTSTAPECRSMMRTSNVPPPRS